MNATLTASTAYSEIVAEVEKIANDDHAVIATMSPGDVVRQGDIYLLALDEPIPGGKPSGTRQLALGSTQGSRHFANGDCEILTVDAVKAEKVVNRLVPTTKGQTLFFGPMIRSRKAVRISHPEHGDRTLPPGDYLVTYQRTWAGEVRRTQD